MGCGVKNTYQRQKPFAMKRNKNVVLNLMPIKIQKGFSAILVMILMVVLAGLVLGGIYYYAEIYQPQKYAKAVVPLFDSVTAKLQNPDTSRIKDDKDYLGVQAIIEERDEFLNKIKDELAALKPPKKMQQIQSDFQVVLQWLIPTNSDHLKIITFIKDAQELYKIIKIEGTPPNPTVSDVLNIYGEMLPKAKVAAQKLFDNKLPSLVQKEYDKLKALWEDAEVGLEANLAYLKSQDQSLPADDALDKAKREADPKTQQELAKIDKFDEFQDQLERVAQAPAKNMVPQFDNPPAQVQEAGQRLETAIKELKQKYQK